MGTHKAVPIGGLTDTKLALTTATAGDVLSGKTFYSGNKTVKTGTIPSKGATTYGAKTSAQTIQAGQYLSGAQTIAAVTQSNLSAANIIKGKTVTIASNGSNLWSVTGTAVTSCSNTHSFNINQTYTINCGFKPTKIVVIIKYSGQTIVLEYDNNNPNVLIESTLGSRTEQNNNTHSVRIKTTENGFTYWTSNYAYVGYHCISYAMQ